MIAIESDNLKIFSAVATAVAFLPAATTPSPESDDLKTLGAIAAALASIVVSVLSAAFGFLATRANQRDVERLKAQFSEEKGEADARRAYTYEALKRLYAEYEPLRFQLVESVESAVRTIQDLAEISKERNSEVEGTLPRGNYLRAALVYHLLAPAAYFKILQSRLTLVDLSASKPSYLQYLLSKEACSILTRDRFTAKHFGLKYSPYVTGWRELRQEDPGRYRRQGFAYGRFDNAVCALLMHTTEGGKRVMTFGEFETGTKAIAPSDYNSPLGAALDLFDEFSPETRPVLWRCLLLQFCLHHLFLHTARSGTDNIDHVKIHLTVVSEHLQELGVSTDLTKRVIDIVTAESLNDIQKSFGNR